MKNTQRYSFDRGHSLWRMLLLPHGDLQLSVLTRFTLSGEHKVRYTQAQCSACLGTQDSHQANQT